MFLAMRRLHNSGRVALHQCGKPKGLCMMDVRILRLSAFFFKKERRSLRHANVSYACLPVNAFQNRVIVIY